MKGTLYRAAVVLLIVAFIPFLGHSSDKGDLESRIRGWISAINQRSYDQCLKYVAPPKFIGGRGLTRTIRGGEESLIFSGDELLPFGDYKIKKVDFQNNEYEAKVTIDAEVIFQPTFLPIEEKGNAKPGIMVFPAFIRQRWIFLNGQWFIRSQFRTQYLRGS